MLGLIFCFFTFAAACSTNLRNAGISSNITSSLENRVELLEQIIFASLEKQEKSVKVAIDEHEKRVRNLKVELNEIRTDPVEDAKTCDSDDENLKIDSLERQSQLRLFEKNTFVSKNKRDVRPYLATCAFNGLWKPDPGDELTIVTFERKTLDANNCDQPSGACGILDPETGVFTAITTGLYVVTFSGIASPYSSDFYVEAFPYHNGVEVPESRWLTFAAKASELQNYLFEQGSRTVVSIGEYENVVDGNK